MLDKNIIVVGSGIAGLTAAYFEAKKGSKVTLIDADSRIGGLLKSDYASDRYFDYGTHILTATGKDELDDFLFSGLDESNCVISKKINAANYFNGEMNSNSCYADASTIGRNAFNQGCMDLLMVKKVSEVDNLEDGLLQKFGKVFYEEIYAPVTKKYMGMPPNALSAKVGSFFDMSRVLAFDEKSTHRLCNVDAYNSTLGHHRRLNGVVKYYPKRGGVEFIINFLIENLKAENVEIKLSTHIKSIKQNNGRVISLLTKSEEIPVDELIWTLPSSLLANLSGLEIKAEPPQFRKTGLYDFVFKDKLSTEATYINVYDTRMRSGRVSLYQNLSQTDNYSCTIEALVDDDIELDNLIGVIQNEMVEMGIVDLGNQCLFRQYRPIKQGFPLLTNQFVEQQIKVGGLCDSYYNNVMFIGRATGKVFFMNEVLIDAYESVRL